MLLLALACAVDKGEHPCEVVTLLVDLDGDSWGSEEVAERRCLGPGETAPLPGDCDDLHSSVAPTRPELCDDLDNDCDGQVDEHTIGGIPWWVDRDGDGFGSGPRNQDCAPPEDAALEANDCDDDDPTVYPGAPEQPDEVDADCDGLLYDGEHTGMTATYRVISGQAHPLGEPDCYRVYDVWGPALGQSCRGCVLASDVTWRLDHELSYGDCGEEVYDYALALREQDDGLWWMLEEDSWSPFLPLYSMDRFGAFHAYDGAVDINGADALYYSDFHSLTGTFEEAP